MKPRYRIKHKLRYLNEADLYPTAYLHFKPLNIQAVCQKAVYKIIYRPFIYLMWDYEDFATEELKAKSIE